MMVVHSTSENLKTEQVNITFPEGLIGLDNYRQFVLKSFLEQELFQILQSSEEQAFGVVVTNPFWFVPDYSFKLPDSIATQLGDPEDIEVFVIITLAAKPEEITANLLGPVVVSRKKKIGFQVLASDTSYTTRHKLYQTIGGK
jgi:flagellar assembly factor FliW